MIECEQIYSIGKIIQQKTIEKYYKIKRTVSRSCCVDTEGRQTSHSLTA